MPRGLESATGSPPTLWYTAAVHRSPYLQQTGIDTTPWQASFLVLSVRGTLMLMGTLRISGVVAQGSVFVPVATGTSGIMIYNASYTVRMILQILLESTAFIQQSHQQLTSRND